MKTHCQGAKNGPSWFAGMIAGLVAIGTVVADPPRVNEAVAVPKFDNCGPNCEQISGVAREELGAVSVNLQNTLDKLASNNNGVTTAVINTFVYVGRTGNIGNSDIDHPVANAVTSNIAPLNTSPPATVGRFALANIACVNPEGGTGFGAILAVTGNAIDILGADSNRAANTLAA